MINLYDEVQGWPEQAYKDVFGTRAESFARGYSAGRADTNAAILNALRIMSAQIERHIAEDVSVACGEKPPQDN
jgi:hypothetical protein